MNGDAVPLVNVVAHSMGGLIVRAYLYGDATLGDDTQTHELALGSQFLFALKTWNQGTDDLRGA